MYRATIATINSCSFVALTLCPRLARPRHFLPRQKRVSKFSLTGLPIPPASAFAPVACQRVSPPLRKKSTDSTFRSHLQYAETAEIRGQVSPRPNTESLARGRPEQSTVLLWRLP